MLTNCTEAVLDLELQVWGMHCILEFVMDSPDTAGEALLEAGLIEALRKVRKGRVGGNPRWKEIAAMVFAELDWDLQQPTAAK